MWTGMDNFSENYKSASSTCMILKFLSYGYSVAPTMLAKLSFHVVSFCHECMHTKYYYAIASIHAQQSLTNS